jgi:hypothetical protein
MLGFLKRTARRSIAPVHIYGAGARPSGPKTRGCLSCPGVQARRRFSMLLEVRRGAGRLSFRLSSAASGSVQGGTPIGAGLVDQSAEPVQIDPVGRHVQQVPARTASQLRPCGGAVRARDGRAKERAVADIDEQPPEVVAGKDVIFVTTNGTRAIADAASAERVLLGCLRNLP